MTEIEQLKAVIKNSEEKLLLANALEALQKSKHFKKVFTDTYLKEYPLALIERKAMMGMQEPKFQTHIEGQISAIGYLKQFINFINQEGLIAKENIDKAKEEIELIVTKGE